MRRAVLAAGIALLTSSCVSDDAAWMLRQASGQMQVLFGARPIAPLIADKATDPVVRERLGLVTAARNFARDELGLAVGFQYRSVTFIDGPAVVYVVSAALPTSLDPYEWVYPVLGALPYRGFFDLEEAEHEATVYEEKGYDVDVRPVSTYSLLGILPDPVVSPMLFGSDELRLVETVIHELAHATVFAPGQGAFNEGMASFIGREGRRLFVERFYGRGSAIAARMAALDDDDDIYGRAVSALAFDLRVLFAQARALSREELLARKDAIFLVHQTHFQREVTPTLRTFRARGARLPDNNAELSAYGIYTLKQHVYEQAYARCREDMRCFLAQLRRVAREPDPELALSLELSHAPPAEEVIR